LTDSGVRELSPAKQALLAQRLRQGAVAAPRRIIPGRPAGDPPLSHAQERLWFLEQFAPGTGQLTIRVSLRLRGQLDTAALSVALDAIAASHEALRMRYPATGDGQPRVVVTDDATLPLTVRDSPDEAAARALAADFMAAPFDLAAGPVARALLVRLEPAITCWRSRCTISPPMAGRWTCCCASSSPASTAVPPTVPR
jgi:hypothetical protein